MSETQMYNTDEFEKQTVTKIPKAPFGFIQWKGTGVCMDVHCDCGCHFHIDSDFAYYVKCPRCKKVYECNPYIELKPMAEEPDHCVVTGEDEEA